MTEQGIVQAGEMKCAGARSDTCSLAQGRFQFESVALTLDSKVNPSWWSTGLNIHTLHLLALVIVAEASCAGPVVNDDHPWQL